MHEKKVHITRYNIMTTSCLTDIRIKIQIGRQFQYFIMICSIHMFPWQQPARKTVPSYDDCNHQVVQTVNR